MARDYEDDYVASYYWWGAPTGWTDYDLYDYNNNWVLDDNEIEDLVMDNIASDPGITLSDTGRIKVKVKNGEVTLSGEVRNPRTLTLAYADAFWSTGVTSVNNKLKVKERTRKKKGK